MDFRDAIEKVRLARQTLSAVPSVLFAVVKSRIQGDGDAELVLQWALSEHRLRPNQKENQGFQSEVVKQALTPPASGSVRLYSWRLSYFSGKVRAYLRYKARKAPAFSFEEVVATPEVIAKVLAPATHSRTVPQLQTHDRFVQDSTEIVDVVENLLPDAPKVLPSAHEFPRQRLTCDLIELFGDEWLLTPAFHWRWAYSGDGSIAQRMPSFMNGVKPLPSHRAYNEKQWGEFLRPHDSDIAQVRSARWFFDNLVLGGAGAIKQSMIELGVTETTVAAWEASARNVLRILNVHFTEYDFILGGRVSMADFGLLGPLYAHLFQDPVPGKMMREEFPQVAAWCERVHDRASATEKPKEEWFADDFVPGTILELIQVFFIEFWPVLESTCKVLTQYLQARGNSAHPILLPGKSFGPECAAQRGHGSLTHSFSLPFDAHGNIGVSHGRRLVNPYHVWMLQRVELTVQVAMEKHPERLKQFLEGFRGGSKLLNLPILIKHCRVRKDGGLLYSDSVARSKL